MRSSGVTPPIFLAGPTAVGKSSVALLLAQRLNGEIVSVDSMQVYRGLDIGSAKPSLLERRRAPHHLIDVAEVTEAFDVARFVVLAHLAVEQIQDRGRLPVFCGGTGLYFKAFFDGLGQAPPRSIPLRSELETTPLPALVRELEEHDPVTYAKIDRCNARRVIRAIEVIRLTGRPFSDQQAPWNRESGSRGVERFFCLMRSDEEIFARIGRRVDNMFSLGLVEETQNLLKSGLERNPCAMQAIGYRQVVEHLHGQRSLAETIALVKLRTRQLAKRQLRWFRLQLKPRWLSLSEEASPEAFVDRLISGFEKEGL